MTLPHPTLASAVEAGLGASVVAMRRVQGGDVAEAFRCDLGDGRTVFAKTHQRPRPDFFATEAAGLAWLRASEAVAVPEVLLVGERHLVLEWIDEGRGTASTEVDLGRALAALHRSGAPCFGREDRRRTGSLGVPNEPCDSWPDLYGAQRLAPLAAIARDRGALPDAAIAGLEHLAGRLAEVGGPPEPAARLHGDLWAGNRLVDRDGRSWLIDPAAHGGHREFDLAMMRLFGGYGADCFAAYHEAFPLADGWQDRVALHQIAPLVVHAIKFGGTYVPTATQAIAQYR
ncbi:MAG: fructosamine kinase family protein [Acidimicrobiales bacterium]